MQQSSVRYSVLISFLAGLIVGIGFYRGMLWKYDLAVIETQTLEQQLSQVAELQEENRQLTEELFNPWSRGYPQIDDGDLPYDENADARAAVERHFGGWARAGSPRPTVEDPEPIGPSQLYLIDRAGSVQTNLVVGTQAINRTSPDYDRLTLMNQIVGGVRIPDQGTRVAPQARQLGNDRFVLVHRGRDLPREPSDTWLASNGQRMPANRPRRQPGGRTQGNSKKALLCERDGVEAFSRSDRRVNAGCVDSGHPRRGGGHRKRSERKLVFR